MDGSAASIIKVAESFVGLNERDGSFIRILNIYNSQAKLPRGYKIKTTDEWCAAFVSACAIQAGVTNFPFEVGCYEMMKKAMADETWIENDGYVPTAGDLILYDWKDNGVGDNKGTPKHVGICKSIDANNIYVTEGNKGERVDHRTVPINGIYIRGFIHPKYNIPVAPVQTVDLESVARDVIKGKYGVGETRKSNLARAGFDPVEVQKVVNQLLATKVPSNSSPATYYIVRKGDNLSKIAKMYDTTVSQLAAWNSIHNINLINIGDKLRVK